MTAGGVAVVGRAVPAAQRLHALRRSPRPGDGASAPAGSAPTAWGPAPAATRRGTPVSTSGADPVGPGGGEVDGHPAPEGVAEHDDALGAGVERRAPRARRTRRRPWPRPVLGRGAAEAREVEGEGVDAVEHLVGSRLRGRIHPGRASTRAGADPCCSPKRPSPRARSIAYSPLGAGPPGERWPGRHHQAEQGGGHGADAEDDACRSWRRGPGRRRARRWHRAAEGHEPQGHHPPADARR